MTEKSRPEPATTETVSYKPLVIATSIGIFAASLGWRAVDPILPLLASDLRVGLADVVLFVSGYSFALALMQLLFGPVGDAWGKLRVLRGTLVLVIASLVLMALAPDYNTALIARILGGAFAGGVIPVSLALLSERIPVAQRQAALGPFVASMLGGQMIGAAISGVLVDHAGWRPVFALCAVAVTAATLLNFYLLGSPKEARTKFSFGGAFANYRAIVASPSSRTVLTTLVGEGVLILGVIPFIAGMVLLHGAEGSSEAGITIGTFAIGGVAFGFVVRRILATLGPWHMLRVGGALAGFALMATALPIGWIVIAGLFFVVGFGFYMFHNTIQLHVTELMPAARGASVSIGAFFFMCGQALGPVLWAPVAAHAGYATLFIAAGIGSIAMGLVVAWRLELQALRLAAREA
jgi:DHA1 family inner membrane transport protein